MPQRKKNKDIYYKIKKYIRLKINILHSGIVLGSMNINMFIHTHTHTYINLERMQKCEVR